MEFAHAWVLSRRVGGREPDRVYEPLARDACSLARALDGGARGPVEEAQHELVVGEQQRAEVDDAVAGRAPVEPHGAAGDMLELALADAGPETLCCVEHRVGTLTRRHFKTHSSRQYARRTSRGPSSRGDSWAGSSEQPAGIWHLGTAGGPARRRARARRRPEAAGIARADAVQRQPGGVP